MPKATLQQKLIAAISTWKEWTLNEKAITSRYVVFTHNERPINLYIGKKGAVRVGKTISGSRPANGDQIMMWVDVGTKILEGNHT